MNRTLLSVLALMMLALSGAAHAFDLTFYAGIHATPEHDGVPACLDRVYLAHGVVFFHNYMEDGGMTRGVQVIKMRGTNIDCDIRSSEFTDGGLVIDPSTKVDV